MDKAKAKFSTFHVGLGVELTKLKAELAKAADKELKEATGASEEALARGKALSLKLKELSDALALRKSETEAKPTLKAQAAELQEIAAKREGARSIRGQAQVRAQTLSIDE